MIIVLFSKQKSMYTLKPPTNEYSITMQKTFLQIVSKQKKT